MATFALLQAGSMGASWRLGVIAVIFLFSYAFAGRPMENAGMFEGDIANVDPNIMLDRNAVVKETQLWPGGVVYYEIDSELSKYRSARDAIREAIKDYESKTCLRFLPKTDDTRDYVLFVLKSGCYSSVGRVGGAQDLSLTFGCHDKASAVHEMGHAIGLWHEQSRSDRDDYLEILWDNIAAGRQHNFNKLKPSQNNLLGETFDYKSIMLYDEYSFSKDGRSMTMKPRQEGVVIGPMEIKPGLSDADARKINKLYECFGNKRPPVKDDEPVEFKCDFEEGFCGLRIEGLFYNYGYLGERTGSYLWVTNTSFHTRVRTKVFDSKGHKTGCFRYDVYHNVGGAVFVDLRKFTSNGLDDIEMVYWPVRKYVKRKNEWQTVKVEVSLNRYTEFDLSPQKEKSSGEQDDQGFIALDNIEFSLGKCN